MKWLLGNKEFINMILQALMAIAALAIFITLAATERGYGCTEQGNTSFHV